MSIKTYCIKSLNDVSEKMEIKPQGPFDFNTIIYQNAGVRELLTFELTEQKGITANLNFTTLQQWINKLAKSLGYEENQEPLIWKILGIFRDL